MARQFNVQLIALLHIKDHEMVMRLTNEMKEMDDSESTFALIENIVSQYPMIVNVDGEIWQSVDRQQADIAQVVILLRDATLTDDALEGFADADEWRDSAIWCVMNNKWELGVLGLVAE